MCLSGLGTARSTLKSHVRGCASSETHFNPDAFCSVAKDALQFLGYRNGMLLWGKSSAYFHNLAAASVNVRQAKMREPAPKELNCRAFFGNI
jgi:hypothetical protein